VLTELYYKKCLTIPKTHKNSRNENVSNVYVTQQLSNIYVDTAAIESMREPENQHYVKLASDISLIPIRSEP